MQLDQLEGKLYEYLYAQTQADEEWSRKVLEWYMPYFEGCRHVLDVGCGRGLFIELLSARGISATGVDRDERMVQICRKRGVDVVHADLFEYLPQQKGQFDGIFCSNLIEHLTIEQAFQFVQMAFEALIEGGIILITTPNPESLIVHLYEFWRDPTHMRLYNRSLLEFILATVGFNEIQSGTNPYTAWDPPAGWQIPSVAARQEVPNLWQKADAIYNTNRSFGPRLFSHMRRWFGRFLAQRVLFEEFTSLHEAYRSLHEAYRSLHEAYRSLSSNYVAPREIFAAGRKPFQ
jgi:2-polyprenyl-3-methyl-5-hydroxy-6-metoxy-1,4-benzoquinol methylase